MKKYAKYKDSGVKWIGQVPEHWEVKRLNAIYSQKVADDSELLQSGGQLLSVFLDKGVIPFSDISSRRTNAITENTDMSKYQKVDSGDFVLNNQQAWRGSVGVSFYNGIISPAYIVLSQNSRIKCDASYFNLLLRSSAIVPHYVISSKGVGSIQRNVVWQTLKNRLLPIPPFTEQQSIVVYLNDKTSKIEQYVRKRERERELLGELKQAEIANVVTKGLDPNAKMKDSGIPWIGMIPEHWETRSLAQLSKEHFISNKTVHNQNLLSLSYGRIVNKDINTTEGLLPASFDNYQIIEVGNIVLRLTDLQNDHKSLRVGLSTQEGIITSAYLALEVFKDVNPKYLYYLLHSVDVKKVFYSMGNGLRQNLNWLELRKLKCILPPLSEQQAIVSYIDSRVAKIDSYIADLQAEIDYLKEFKQRLISDVVTGQINVCDTADRAYKTE